MSRELRILIKDPDSARDVAASLAKQLDDPSLRVEPWQVTFSSVLAVLQFVQIVFHLHPDLFRRHRRVGHRQQHFDDGVQSACPRVRDAARYRAQKNSAFGDDRHRGRPSRSVGGAGRSGGRHSLRRHPVERRARHGRAPPESLGFASRIYPQFDVVDALFSFVFGVLIAVFSSLYAARVSSRLTVSEALTHV